MNCVLKMAVLWVVVARSFVSLPMFQRYLLPQSAGPHHPDDGISKCV